MYNKIKKIFSSKIVENIQELNRKDYYYFYQDLTCKKFFAIKKDITKSEYNLLKALFIEKKQYAENSDEQKCYEYLFDNREYPFTEEKSFIVYTSHENDFATINKIISEVYQDCVFINYLNYVIVFCKKFENIKDMFQAMTIDFGYEIIVHEGFKINHNTEGKDLLIYYNYFAENFGTKAYSKFNDIVIKANNNNKEVISVVRENVVNKICMQHSLIELINAFFHNNLNVSLTSKLLYMHRNSLLNKLDQIEKLTSLNIQNFLDAYVMKILIDWS